MRPGVSLGPEDMRRAANVESNAVERAAFRIALASIALYLFVAALFAAGVVMAMLA